MSSIEIGKGYILVKDVPISDELRKRLSEKAIHIYRDTKGNIANTIKCVGVD